MEKRIFRSITRLVHSLPLWAGLGLGLLFASCASETDDVWDPYYNWETRNAEWFEQIADSARTAIADAKAQYGDATDETGELLWEKNCDWRMLRSLQRCDSLTAGATTDSICVHIRRRGDGTVSPLDNDTAYVCFRGWTMCTEYEAPYDTKVKAMAIFTQTFVGEFNPQTAQPQPMIVNTTVEGFGTALQYMAKGDIWDVYIPQQLAYGEKASDAIPAYSTLLFRLYMMR